MYDRGKFFPVFPVTLPVNRHQLLGIELLHRFDNTQHRSFVFHSLWTKICRIRMKNRIYTGGYSQSPQSFPQIKSKCSDCVRIFRHFPTFRTAIFLHQNLKRIWHNFYASDLFSQDRFGGIGIEGHIPDISRQILVIALGADHCRIVSAQGKGR